jgi:hypothetical protein
VEIPRSSRQALLAEIRGLESMKPIRTAFEAVGASRPVELTVDQRAELLHVLEVWAARERPPAGIGALRRALTTAGG